MKKCSATISSKAIEMLKSQLGRTVKSYARMPTDDQTEKDFTFETVGLCFDDRNIAVTCHCDYFKGEDLEIGTFNIQDLGTSEIPSPIEAPWAHYLIDETLTSVEIVNENLLARASGSTEFEIDHTIGIVFSFETKKLTIGKTEIWSDTPFTCLTRKEDPAPLAPTRDVAEDLDCDSTLSIKRFAM